MSVGQNDELNKSGNRVITPERRGRIDRLKKMIVWTVACMILVPTVGCVLLGIGLYRKGKSEKMLTEQVGFLEENLRESVKETERLETLLEESEAVAMAVATVPVPVEDSVSKAVPEEEETPEESAVMENQRKVYLTFDDGPSIYTEELLDVLKQYDVKATFFVTGKGKERYGDTYRRIVEEGHTLGMHSYSHEYESIYESLESFEKDFGELQNFLYNETGTVSRFYRFPGGSSNQVSKTDIREMTAYLSAMDIRYFDWNVSSGDASSAPVSSEALISNVMEQLPSHRVAVVLMHDAANKHSTVEALPGLIEQIQALDDMETEILPITDETMLIQHALGE